MSRNAFRLGLISLLFAVPQASSLADSTAGTTEYDRQTSRVETREDARLSKEKRLQKEERAKRKGKVKGKGKGGESATAPEEPETELFLPETAADQVYLPDIFRCSECGYEQDEPGTCPDHEEVQLIKVLSKGRNPLEPAEFDGNEDLIVDIPITGLTVRKAPTTVASPTGQLPPDQKAP